MKKNLVPSRLSTMTTLASFPATPVKEMGPWSGRLDEDEMARPGTLLLGALLQRAHERGQPLDDMARELGRTYGYINQLRTGLRSVSQIPDDFAMECANYLNVPRHTVLMMAGRITPSDMFESTEMKARQIEQAMLFIAKDPAWGPLVTPELQQCAMDSQYCLVRLFEKATNKVLMDRHLDVYSLSTEIRRLTEMQSKKSGLSTGKRRSLQK